MSTWHLSPAPLPNCVFTKTAVDLLTTSNGLVILFILGMRSALLNLNFQYIYNPASAFVGVDGEGVSTSPCSK